MVMVLDHYKYFYINGAAHWHEIDWLTDRQWYAIKFDVEGVERDTYTSRRGDNSSQW